MRGWEISSALPLLSLALYPTTAATRFCFCRPLCTPVVAELLGLRQTADRCSTALGWQAHSCGNGLGNAARTARDPDLHANHHHLASSQRHVPAANRIAAAPPGWAARNCVTSYTLPLYTTQQLSADVCFLSSSKEIVLFSCSCAGRLAWSRRAGGGSWAGASSCCGLTL